MKFQKKIIIIYMLFSCMITCVFGSAYYLMNVSQYRTKEYADIREKSKVKMEKMEDMLDGMSSVVTYFLSDVEVLNALQDFTELDAKSYEELYYNAAASTIRNKLTSYYLINEYYRTVVFNKAGNVIANTNYGERVLDETESYQTYPWKDKVSGHGGKNVILGIHEDGWGKIDDFYVLSLVKEIQGMDMGYIEVQQSGKVLDEMFSDDEQVQYIFLTKDEELIYTNLSLKEYQHYVQQIADDNGKVYNRDGRQVLCEKMESDVQDIILLTITDKNINYLAAREVFPVVMAIFAGALVLSLSYVYFTSRYLTRPIRQLQTFMEMTGLDNMGDEIPEKISNDEIGALYTSYKDVLKRLKKSILNEKRISMLQLQAQFDLLQAQVNPHFIYNVLNVISSRGMMSGDEEICDICSELASMLRYSTNTKEKYATVKNEIGYLEQYLHLLKYRYDYKLSYQISINDNIYDKFLPKIVMQQIVENSIIHGYSNTGDTIQITVTGDISEEGWYLKVHDCGSGMDETKRKEVYAEIELIKKKLSTNRANVEMEIGGMGLVNTYARLFLLYNDKLTLSIKGKEGKGTDVIIMIKE